MINRLDVLTVITIFLVAIIVPFAFFGVEPRVSALWLMLFAACLVISGVVLCMLDRIRMMGHDQQ